MIEEHDARLRQLPNWSEHFELRYVLEHYHPRRILDFGCGYGFMDFYLAGADFRVFGYDPSTERIEIAEYIRQHRPEPIQQRVQFSSVQWPIQEYDLVWASHVFEHIPYEKWKSIFDRLPRCEILISVPLGFAYDMPEHIHHWGSGKELQEFLNLYTDYSWDVAEDQGNRVIRARTNFLGE